VLGKMVEMYYLVKLRLEHNVTIFFIKGGNGGDGDYSASPVAGGKGKEGDANCPGTHGGDGTSGSFGGHGV
jgi:hypothetical protein